MTDRVDAEAIAAGLSEAQKRCLSDDMRDIANPPVWLLCGDTALSNRMIPSMNVLTKKGLLEHGRFGRTMLTAAGLAVRAILLRDQGEE